MSTAEAANLWADTMPDTYSSADNLSGLVAFIITIVVCAYFISGGDK